MEKMMFMELIAQRRQVCGRVLVAGVGAPCWSRLHMCRPGECYVQPCMWQGHTGEGPGDLVRLNMNILLSAFCCTCSHWMRTGGPSAGPAG